MWGKWIFALVAVCSLTGCCSLSQYRPCGPGIFNNVIVPQGFAGVDFRAACARHDSCYGICGHPRKQCDDRFLQELQSACGCSRLPTLCRMRAAQWYSQVRLFGGGGYGQMQGQNCPDCGGCCACDGSGGCCSGDGSGDCCSGHAARLAP